MTVKNSERQYKNQHPIVGNCYNPLKTGRGSVWLERLLWEQEATGSSPVAPTINL